MFVLSTLNCDQSKKVEARHAVQGHFFLPVFDVVFKAGFHCSSYQKTAKCFLSYLRKRYCY